ncbi:uncharacterized protein TRIVIDRAFT_230926 [Trichoderma virens Gv29-8]|uniref:SRP9 domain-containing protein n=1 Tax=Hypocrea virens (strain Gv29-8 / FGSC 10586) TaxID=413071 RepID=G9MWF3_HYPVG|nr:uncharacterized protein TRIVIDRAFT_230926 [Trichoderma virens Gv29-8]EHK21289.1 hypothetical protein TRIVIDRAFT_230926 [Trichoderma virens Gv29-8]
MKDMLCSFLLSILANTATGAVNEEYKLMKDQLILQHAWTEMDLFKIFTTLSPTIIGPDMLLLLHNVEECDKNGREIFWRTLSTITATTEVPFKVVVTCKNPFDLSDELHQWPDIPVTTYNIGDKKEYLSQNAEGKYSDDLLSMLCPGGHGEAKIRKKLIELRSMKTKDLDTILKLIMDLTDWPQDVSQRSLREFYHRLQAVTLKSTPADILRQSLQDILDRDGLRWILNWLLNGQQPLSYNQLATALFHFKRGKDDTFHAPSPTELQEPLSHLRLWVRGITESFSGQVRLREEFRGYFQNKSNHLEDYLTPSENILVFLFDYLTSPEIQGRLDSLYNQYQSKVGCSGNHITPPLVTDGQDFIFYAIQALPYHLSQDPNFLLSKSDMLTAITSKLIPWSRVYWAMSNPFSRPKFEALQSPFETLLTLGNLGLEAVSALKEIQYSTCPPTTNTHEMSKAPVSVGMNSLSDAIREGKENAALSLAEELILASGSQNKVNGETATLQDSSKISWPSWFLWRAVWLNMDRLVALLLNNGMKVDPEDGDSIFFPSPLYMAVRLGHALIMETLIERGARLDVKRPGMDNLVCSAAVSGSIHAINSLMVKNKSLLKVQELEKPLYAASLYGNWKAVKRLLELGADPNSGIGERSNDGGAPLIVAAERGNIKTAQMLLKHNADPNIIGPRKFNTPLWFAAVKSAKADLVSLLLDHGADPNHKLINPPLLVEIITASPMRTNNKLAILSCLTKDSTALINIAHAGGMTPLLYAANEGDLDIVKWLLAYGADINATDNQGHSALCYAIAKMHVDVVRELLRWEQKLDILTKSGNTLLDMAINNVSVVQMLLDAGVNSEWPNRDNQTAINTAVIMRKTDVVKLLVERGANIHHRDNTGESPILNATRNIPNAEIIRILLDGDANLRDEDPDSKYTPLHYAMNQEKDIAKILLEFRNNIDLEKRDINGRTALLVAAWGGRFEHIKLLVEAGADINAQDHLGWTTLSYALCHSSAFEVVDWLLWQPAMEIDTIGTPVGTALMVACYSLNEEMVFKLLSRGANPNMPTGYRYCNNALKAACRPWKKLNLTYEERMHKIDAIIYMLVEYGADVDAMEGNTIYNAISAASFSAGSSTINLLSNMGATAETADPLGRFPLHFAAASGLKNFEVMLRLHKGNLMVRDCSGRTVLHWAAQFGHVETIEAILKIMSPSGKSRRNYINQPDIDGWTPLCWATQPLTKYNGFYPNLRFEPYSQREVVKYLIDNGADRGVTFNIEAEDNVETFTLVQMAKLCNVKDDIIKMLADDLDGTSTKNIADNNGDVERRYACDSTTCSICFNAIFGCQYECQSCLEFSACKKCYGRINIYHGHFTLEDGKPHQFVSLKFDGQDFYQIDALEAFMAENGQDGDDDEDELPPSVGRDGLWTEGYHKMELCDDDDDDGSSTRVTAKYSIKPVKPRKSDPSSADESSPSDPKPPRGSLVLKTYDPVSGVALKYRTTKAAEVTRLMYAAMGRLGRAQANVQDVPEETMQDADAVETPQGEQTPQQTQQQGAAGGGGGGKKKKKGKK